LLADAPPEAEPLPLRLVPAIAAEVAPVDGAGHGSGQADIAVGSAVPRSTEPLAEPFAAPDPTAFTLLAIEAGPPRAPLTIRRRCRTL